MKKIEFQNDHDLLVRLDQKATDLKQAIQDLQDGTFQKIAALENDKADKVLVDLLRKKIDDDIEARTRKLEDKTSNYKIAFTLYSIAVGFMIALILYHILSQPKI